MTLPLRIGILGCGGVSEYSMLQPARDDNAVTVVAVAARDGARAAAYAQKHGIPRSYGSYGDLLADSGIDAVYVALPNSNHRQWAIAALRAGLPVLCEKPMASNADQAAEMAQVADETGVLLVEAFHWRFHPFARRLQEIARSGTLGRLRRVEASFIIPSKFLLEADPTNIRFDPALGGGSMMDHGCYCISLLRHLGPGEPDVVSATAKTDRPELDLSMTVDLRFPDGTAGLVTCSMNDPGDALRCTGLVVGENGSLAIEKPYFPQWGSRLDLTLGDETVSEVSETTPSYLYQARAFAELVRSPPKVSPAWDGVANMRVVDAAYRAAGLTPRL